MASGPRLPNFRNIVGKQHICAATQLAPLKPRTMAFNYSVFPLLNPVRVDPKSIRVSVRRLSRRLAVANHDDARTMEPLLCQIGIWSLENGVAPLISIRLKAKSSSLPTYTAYNFQHARRRLPERNLHSLYETVLQKCLHSPIAYRTASFLSI